MHSQTREILVTNNSELLTPTQEEDNLYMIVQVHYVSPMGRVHQYEIAGLIYILCWVSERETE